MSNRRIRVRKGAIEQEPANVSLEKKLFSSSALESLTDEERRSRLDLMARELKAFIGRSSSRHEFLQRSKRSIDMLRSMGHDLWSIDSDGETFAIWESDYARPKLMGRLVVSFTYPDRVSAEWSSTL
jgi:hypothetical protein